MNLHGCRLLLLLLAFHLAAPVQAERIVRITNGEWPPYLSEHLPHYGIASRIVTEAFALQGIAVQYGFFPWPRALASAKTGIWDGTAVWQHSEERERDFYFSEPVFDSGGYVFFHLKKTAFTWSNIDDLARYRIGITNDYFYGEEFQSAVKLGKLAVEGVTSEEQNFRKLLGERIDAFPIIAVVGFAMLNQHFPPSEASRITHHPKILYNKPMFLLLSKKDPRNQKLMEEFNQGLQKLKASGKFDVYLRAALIPAPAPGAAQ